MIPVYLGLGSNLGDRESNLKAALDRLAARGLKIERVSSLYETEPVGFTGQPRFFNVVVKARTQLLPGEVLEAALQVERELGRRRECRWGPRTIDVDILLYGREKIKKRNLEVPHPRLGERAFVLVPLAEVEPKLSLPDGTSVQDLLEGLDTRGVQVVSHQWWPG